MFVRLLYLTILPEHVDEVKRLYREEIIPAVREYKGYVDSALLEPVNRGDSYIVMWVWKRQSDALVYESSELYDEQRYKLVSFATGVPILKTYTYESVAREVHLVK